jgi:hypothetical protein
MQRSKPAAPASLAPQNSQTTRGSNQPHIRQDRP